MRPRGVRDDVGREEEDEEDEEEEELFVFSVFVFSVDEAAAGSFPRF